MKFLEVLFFILSMGYMGNISLKNCIDGPFCLIALAALLEPSEEIQPGFWSCRVYSNLHGLNQKYDLSVCR